MGTDPGSSYDELKRKVAGLHERVEGRYPGALRCRAGCSMCCHQHLSVVVFEFRRIAEAVLALPESERRALAERAAGDPADPRCVLLDERDRCRVYEARPLICRSHGLPVRVRSESGATERDVCPLNFAGEGPPLAEVDEDAVLDVERLNTLLGLIERLDAEGTARPRVDLAGGLRALLEGAAAPDDDGGGRA